MEMLNERISKFQLHLCTLNRCGLRVRLVFVLVYLDTMLPRIQNTNSESLNDSTEEKNPGTPYTKSQCVQNAQTYNPNLP